MNKSLSAFLIGILFCCSSLVGVASNSLIVKGTVSLRFQSEKTGRVLFGADWLTRSLSRAGYHVMTQAVSVASRKAHFKITIEVDTSLDTRKEGYLIKSEDSGWIKIIGKDASGALYGCVELADLVKNTGKLPFSIDKKDAPEMVLRGTCIGMQKAIYLPGRKVYEYPYTPKTFPWFYDKTLWIRFLDSLVENKMNSLYLWNGHPFASLVRVKDYPYAVEVDSATFKKNEEIFRFLTHEADKRGIWIIQMFYNIIVSKPFAEKNHLATQDRDRHIIPIIADYTRKSIAAFVAKYPHIGLGLTLGEAMEGVGQDDIDWFTKTIIPGVLDGLKILGQKEEPPLILRAHDTDAPTVMKFALPLYHNLYTMAKYNGEALTTYTPRGSWAQLHRKLSSLGSVLIENVHIMANLEPFRYGSPDFIQKCVEAMHHVYGANALHLYPQASYWDWPYSADSVRLYQLDRDWVWYKAWSRYAWNSERSREDEIAYWSHQFADYYGCNETSGKCILEAYEQSGEISPKLLRRIGITDGNRQTLTLGMFMNQLIDPKRYNLFTLLYESEAPEGEDLRLYADREWNHLSHKGETPAAVADDVQQRGLSALLAIRKADAFIHSNRAEYLRLENDMRCYKSMADFYAEKIRAAIWVLRYQHSHNLSDLDSALNRLKLSVDGFKKLTSFTLTAYRYANSMQTSQRKIPIRGVNATYKTWHEMLPLYEHELAIFAHHLDSLHQVGSLVVKDTVTQRDLLLPASVSWIGKAPVLEKMHEGFQPFTDTSISVKAYASVLGNLQFIKINYKEQQKNGTILEFNNTVPVKFLVGYAVGKIKGFLPVPELEFDANANNFGQSDVRIAHAISIDKFPSFSIHTYQFEPGHNRLLLGPGTCLLLGIVDARQPFPEYDAGLGDASVSEGAMDWLFE